MSSRPTLAAKPFGHPPDLRLFLAVQSVVSLLSGTCRIYPVVGLLAPAVVVVTLCYGAGLTPADGRGLRRRIQAAVAANRDVFAIGIVLLLCGAVLRGSEILLLAGLYIGFSCSPPKKRRSPQGIRFGLSLALVLTVATAALHRSSCLVGESWFRWPVAASSQLWGWCFGLGRLGMYADKVIVDGTAIHLSWLHGTGICLPVLYCLLASGEAVRVKAAKGVGALFAASASSFAIVHAASLFDYAEFPVPPTSVAVPVFQSMAALAISLVLWRWRRMPPVSMPARQFRPALGLVLVPPLCVMLGLLLARNVDERGLRIAIDECHGRWETTDGSFNTTEYGRDTVYNYRLLRDRLASLHTVSVVREQIVGVEADVILVKTPTVYLSDEEKEYLRRFVENGGSLFVIGDHTNLFGSSAIINDAISWTGMRLRYDAVLPVGTRYHDLRPAWWSLIAGDPAIQEVQFQTSCSIAGNPLWHEPLIVAENVVGEDADYSDERFFGGLSPTLDDRRGPLCLAVKARYGKGSVLLFGDSTIWSNFSFFAAGNERLFSSLLWNCRHHSGGGMVAVAALLGVLGLACCARDRKEMLCSATLLGLAAALALAFLLFEVSKRTIGPPSLPPRMEGASRIVLDSTHSSVQLRADTRTGDASDLQDYSTFYAWLSRAGVHPVSTGRAPYETPDFPVLVINPAREFSPAEAAKAETFLKRGGRMLYLFDPALHGVEASACFLARFGVGVKASRAPSALCDAEGLQTTDSVLSLPFALIMQGHAAPGDERMALGQLAYCLVGLTPLLTDDNGLVVAGETQVGAGCLIVFARSTMLSEFFLGDVWGGKEPSPQKRKAYELVYDLARHAVGSASPQR